MRSPEPLAAVAATPAAERGLSTQPALEAARAVATATPPEKARVRTQAPKESHRPATAAATTRATVEPTTQATAPATPQTDRRAGRVEARRQLLVPAHTPALEWPRAWAGGPLQRSASESLEWRAASAWPARANTRSMRAVAMPAPAEAAAQEWRPAEARRRSAQAVATPPAPPCRFGQGGEPARQPACGVDQRPATRPSPLPPGRPRSGMCRTCSPWLPYRSPQGCFVRVKSRLPRGPRSPDGPAAHLPDPQLV